MIKIIDATLTMLDAYEPSEAVIRKFISLLSQISITSIVISPTVYKTLKGKLVDHITYYMEMPFGGDDKSADYPGITYFISVKNEGNNEYIKNVQVNDVSDLNNLYETYKEKNIRLTGVDDILSYESVDIYQHGMEEIKKLNPILYPEDSLYCATAIALDYLQYNKNATVMTTFLGVGNKAATEQVLLAMRVVERYKPNESFKELADLRKLYEQIVRKKVSPYAPVIGENIFHIESGVHVDGVLKKASNYEAYPPELVGAERKIILGKHSGAASVTYKIDELDIKGQFDIKKILIMIKRASMKKSGAITNEEFRGIVSLCQKESMQGN